MLGGCEGIYIMLIITDHNHINKHSHNNDTNDTYYY